MSANVALRGLAMVSSKCCCFLLSSRRRHTILVSDWSSDVCSSDLAQCNHLGDDRLVVGCAAVVAARDPGAKCLFAQVAPGRELEERLDARARGGDDVFAGKKIGRASCRERV